MTDSLEKAKSRAASLESPGEIPKVKPETYKPHMSRATQESLRASKTPEEVESTLDPPTDEPAEAMPGLSLEELRQILMASETRFANEERKNRIKERCKPLDFDDLLTLNEIRQVVPIVSD